MKKLAWRKQVDSIQSQVSYKKVAGALGSERGVIMIGEVRVLPFEEGKRGHKPENAEDI